MTYDIINLKKTNEMAKLVFKLLKVAYKLVLRDVIKKAIDDPNSTVDEAVIELLDDIFDYDGSSEWK